MPTPHALRRLALTGAALGVAALSGCAAVTPTTQPVGTQASPLAPVAVALPVCTTARELDGAPQDPDTESCRPFEGHFAADGSRRPFTSPGSGRLLVVAEVADGTPDPVLRLRRAPGAALVRDDAVVSGHLRPAAVLSTLKATKVNATRRRLHAGRVTCKSSTRCIVSTVVRAGTKRVGFLRFTLEPGKSGAVSLRLSRPATALLARRGGTVTVSVDAGGPKTLVRVTKLAVRKG